MKKHNGMRPQDIVVLLKIIAIKHNKWKYADLAYALQISASEITEALNRSKIAGLIDAKKRKVHQLPILHYLLVNIFPQEWMFMFGHMQKVMFGVRL